VSPGTIAWLTVAAFIFGAAVGAALVFMVALLWGNPRWDTTDGAPGDHGDHGDPEDFRGKPRW
jgi:membrane protein DedA with SNARE-associated domain